MRCCSSPLLIIRWRTLWMACSGYFWGERHFIDNVITHMHSVSTKTVIWGALTHLFGEILYDAVFRHLGADGEASLQLLFYARDHLLIRLSGKSFNTYKHTALLHHSPRTHIQGWLSVMYLTLIQSFLVLPWLVLLQFIPGLKDHHTHRRDCRT